MICINYHYIYHFIDEPASKPQFSSILQVDVESSLTCILGGGGKRKGALAVYLEPWHADVFEFLELRKNHGKEEQRARRWGF